MGKKERQKTITVDEGLFEMLLNSIANLNHIGEMVPEVQEAWHKVIDAKWDEGMKLLSEHRNGENTEREYMGNGGKMTGFEIDYTEIDGLVKAMKAVVEGASAQEFHKANDGHGGLRVEEVSGRHQLISRLMITRLAGM